MPARTVRMSTGKKNSTSFGKRLERDVIAELRVSLGTSGLLSGATPLDGYSFV